MPGHGHFKGLPGFIEINTPDLQCRDSRLALKPRRLIDRHRNRRDILLHFAANNAVHPVDQRSDQCFRFAGSRRDHVLPDFRDKNLSADNRRILRLIARADIGKPDPGGSSGKPKLLSLLLIDFHVNRLTDLAGMRVADHIDIAERLEPIGKAAGRAPRDNLGADVRCPLDETGALQMIQRRADGVPREPCLPADIEFLWQKRPDGIAAGRNCVRKIAGQLDPVNCSPNLGLVK